MNVQDILYMLYILYIHFESERLDDVPEKAYEPYIRTYSRPNCPPRGARRLICLL
jgi:hypothetical protein